MTTAESARSGTVWIGVSGMPRRSTIARFSARAIIPSTVRMTGVPGSRALTMAWTPIMLARASGSGFT